MAHVHFTSVGAYVANGHICGQELLNTAFSF